MTAAEENAGGRTAPGSMVKWNIWICFSLGPSACPPALLLLYVSAFLTSLPPSPIILALNAFCCYSHVAVQARTRGFRSCSLQEKSRDQQAFSLKFACCAITKVM
eukprot:1156785-Pelagomonas_calceolata.AAC.1